MDPRVIKAIVTGGASGLGAAVVAAIRDAGGQAHIFDVAPQQDTGPGASVVDVTDEASVAGGIASARAAMDGLNALVNCAGIATAERVVGRDGPHDLGPFRRAVDVNLVGSFNTMRLAAAEMAGNEPDADGERGVIVNTASVAAFDGQKGQTAYAASKAGIVGLSLPAARDLATQGIRVNAIAPGVFRTPMLEGLGDEIMNGLAADVVFPKRLGQPAEFADAVLFMIRNPYVNGTVLRLDGALRMP